MLQICTSSREECASVNSGPAGVLRPLKDGMDVGQVYNNNNNNMLYRSVRIVEQTTTALLHHRCRRCLVIVRAERVRVFSGIRRGPPSPSSFTDKTMFLHVPTRRTHGPATRRDRRTVKSSFLREKKREREREGEGER